MCEVGPIIQDGKVIGYAWTCRGTEEERFERYAREEYEIALAEMIHDKLCKDELVRIMELNNRLEAIELRHLDEESGIQIDHSINIEEVAYVGTSY